MDRICRTNQILRRFCLNCRKTTHVLETTRFCGLCRTPFGSIQGYANQRPNYIQSYKSQDLSGAENLGVNYDCRICLQMLDIREGNVLELVCRHQFHSDCIEKWFHRRNNCPICRTTQPLILVSKDYEQAFHSFHSSQSAHKIVLAPLIYAVLFKIQAPLPGEDNSHLFRFSLDL